MTKHLIGIAGMLFLGVCAVSTDSDARALTGAGSAFAATGTNSACLGENFAASVNTCSGSLADVFYEAPVDTGGVKTINATSYTITGGSGSFACRSEAFPPGGGGSFSVGTQHTFNSTGSETIAFEGANVQSLWTLRLHCFPMPHNRGIASIQYSQ